MSYGHVIVPPLTGMLLGGGVMVLAGAGDPNQSATDSGNGNLAFCGIGSHFHRTDGPDSTHCFYVKTGATVIGSSPTGTWTAK